MRQTNPWEIWIWPWAATIEAYRRALKGWTPDQAVEPSPRTEPEWSTPNRDVFELAELHLRDFSVGKSDAFPVLIVAPFALHDAAIADLAPHHSIIETLRACGCYRIFLIDWKSATADTQRNTIDSQLSALNVAVDEIGSPVDLVGLCQGGWLSLVYAARFPSKVRRLALVGAPIDTAAESSLLSTSARTSPAAFVDDLIRRGNGLVLGRHTASLWPLDPDKTLHMIESLQLEGPLASDENQRTAKIFQHWNQRLLDLPGPYYRQVFDWLFRDNRLATGAFPALGRIIDLKEVHCPLYLLAGASDNIAPAAQVCAAASLVASATRVETAVAPCGHLALFLGRQTLTKEWPRIATWLLQ